MLYGRYTTFKLQNYFSYQSFTLRKNSPATKYVHKFCTLAFEAGLPLWGISDKYIAANSYRKPMIIQWFLAESFPRNFCPWRLFLSRPLSSLIKSHFRLRGSTQVFKYILYNINLTFVALLITIIITRIMNYTCVLQVLGFYLLGAS